jgi:hypothetical protein
VEEHESIELGVAIDEDEELLADKQQGTSSTDGGDRPTESLSLNF